MLIYEISMDILREYIEDLLVNTGDYYLYNLDPLKIGNRLDPNIMKFYPNILDDDFIDKLVMKYEFLSNQMEKPNKRKKIKLKGFRKSPNQRFVKNFISPDTPYNGILLWHEVGVGKTCAAIGIAENFKERIYLDNKIIILTPSNTLKGSWYDGIYNINTELDNLKESYNKQCTGDNYSKKNIIRPGETKEDMVRIKRRRNKEIEKYYELMGYQKFANVFETKLEHFMEDSSKKHPFYKKLIQFIRNTYSNRVIICDEIQYTREGNIKDDTSGIDGEVISGKKIRNCLELICRYSVNTKIILLSATPMYDVTKEIIWLMNLLLLNDKRPKMNENEYFSKDGLFIKSDKKDKFMKKIKGYISYVRGDNPYIYPVKLWPSIKRIEDWTNLYIPQNIDCLIRAGSTEITTIYSQLSDSDQVFNDPSIKRELNNARIKRAAMSISKGQDDVKDLVLYKSHMSKWQYKEYKKKIKAHKGGYNITPRQNSNIVFPSHDDINISSKVTGDNSFNKLFTKVNNKYKLKSIFVNTGLQKSIFSVDNSTTSSLSKFSEKFNNVVKLVSDSKGICFIYSQFKKYGAHILSIILEANGFERFNCDSKGNILEDQNLSINELDIEIKHKYILLTGDTPKNVLDKLKDYVNEPSNKYGKKIKVVIGTQAVEQGLSFFNVRQLHVIEPWYHLNSVNQVIGRAVRRNSHKELPEKERNVTIYLHVSIPPKNIYVKPLIDERMYIMGIHKYKGILETQRLIKQSAIDCNLNIKGNILDLNKIIKRKDSFGEIREILLGDITGSMRCDFTSCDYKCNRKIDMSQVEIDTDTYNINLLEDEIISIKEIIKNLFKDLYVSDINQISQETLSKNVNEFIKSLKSDSILGDNTSEYIDSVIYKAAERIISNNEAVYNNNKKGFLKKIKDDDNIYYIFQPEKLNDDYIPIKYKYLKLKSSKKDFYIEDIQTSKIPEISLLTDWDDFLVEHLKEAIYSVMYRYPEDFPDNPETSDSSSEYVKIEGGYYWNHTKWTRGSRNNKLMIPELYYNKFKNILKFKVHSEKTIYADKVNLSSYRYFIIHAFLIKIEELNSELKIDVLKYIFEKKYETNISGYSGIDIIFDLSKLLDSQEDILLSESIDIIFDNYFSKKKYKLSYFLSNKMLHKSLEYRRGASNITKKKDFKPAEADLIRYLLIPNVKYIKVTKKTSEDHGSKGDLFRYFIFNISNTGSSKKIKKLSLLKTNRSTDYFDDTFFPRVEPDILRSTIYESLIYGFLEQNDTDEIKFKIVDNLDTKRRRQLTKGSKVSSRDERKGNACGTAGGKRGSKTGMIESFVKYLLKKCGVNMTTANIKKYKTQSDKPSICFEIRLLLRFLEKKGFKDNSEATPPKLTVNYRYLYKKEVKDKIERTIMAFTL